MPIEIKELVIRATTLEEDSPTDDQKVSMLATEDMHAEIVDECVKQVLKILERKRQR